MTRLFVAAWPPDDVVDHLHGLTRIEPVGGERRVAPENWHITLRFLGDADPDELIERLAVAALPPVTATLGPDVTDFERAQIVIPVEGIDPLAEAVRAATLNLGEPPKHQFRAHLTLARTKKKAQPNLLGKPFQANFEINEIRVVSSDLQPTGPVYTTIATMQTDPARPPRR